MTIAFVEAEADRHAQIVAGLSALERAIREAAKAGATRAIVAAAPVAIARPMPIPVEYVPPGTAAPEGATRVRADHVAGVELVDDDARKRAEWALIRRMNKSFEGPVDALINWRFSMRITRVLARRSLAITPNQITITAILVGLVAAVLAWQPGWATLAAGGVLLQVNSILDSCDGELARLRYQYSKVGQWLDNLSDDVVDNAFLVAVGHHAGGIWQWLGIAAAAMRLLYSIVQYVDVYRRTGTGDIFQFRWWFERADATATEVYDPKQISTWLRSFGRRDTFVFIWMLACCANFPYWVVCHGLLASSVSTVMLVMHFAIKASRSRS